jgi:hypothetical protein
MRHAPAFLLITLLLLAAQTAPAKEPDFLKNRHVVILSVYKSFAEARADAERISKASKVPFSMQGRVYDKKRGLIYPDNDEDEAFRGQYFARRYHTTVLKGSDESREYLSVERSDGYDGFKKGFYIVVAGIHENAAAAQADAKRFSAWAPTAYAKKTRIYMGCMH